MTLHINADRFKQDFDSLAQIGSTGDGGVNRPALSDLHLEARRWFLARAAAAGLETRVDSAGNHSAILRCPRPHPRTPTLLIGSHTDSVPDGGRFDGALGVVSALEALRSVKDAGLELLVHLEAIDFTDEEGTLVGLLGSAAIAGKLAADTLKNPRGGRERLTAGLARAGLTEEGLLSAKRDPQTLAGYLELHIEQGPCLFGSGIKIGVVSAIVGINSFKLAYRGKANHAGTTPMDARTDASLGASAFVLAAREMVMRDFLTCVVNVGQMNFKPGAFNIIPGAAELALEFRSPETDELAKLESSLLKLAENVGKKYGLSLTAQAASSCAPAPMSRKVQSAFTAGAESLGLSHVSMPSGAGHDGQSLADLTDVGMIFIPSRDGVSHSPLEFSEWEDCVNGANVLLNAAVKMASGGYNVCASQGRRLNMQSITLHSRVGPDGKLKIEVPVGKPNSEWEVVVVINPISPDESERVAVNDGEFESLVNYGSEQIRKVCAERGIDWDKLDEKARVKLIDEILHEA